MQQCFIGIDIGTQGVRASLVTETGAVIGEASRKFTLTPDSRMEQSPADWWHDTIEVMDELRAARQVQGDPYNVVTLGVDSTSGTVIPVRTEGGRVGKESV